MRLITLHIITDVPDRLFTDEESTGLRDHLHQVIAGHLDAIDVDATVTSTEAAERE